MDQNLKERLVGAAVLIILAVIFIPMFLSDVPITDGRITETNIPEKPEVFSSRIVPLGTGPENISRQGTPDTSANAGSPATTTEPAESPQTRVDTHQTTKAETEPVTVVKEAAKDSSAVGLTAWVVQLGSFSSEGNAQSLNKQLREQKYPAFVEPLIQENKVIYRVRVGPELRRSNAEKLQQEIKKKLGIDGILVKYP